MTQYSPTIESIITESKQDFDQSIEIEQKDRIPSNGEYQLNKWYRVPDVVCVYVDMRNSTQLSATHHDKSTASVYELYTGTAVRIFNSFSPSYIDVKGDGVFALFNKNEVFRAFAAAVTFKTFAQESFIPMVRGKISEIDIGSHMGMDQKTVLVKRIGIRNSENTDTRNNEVWAGKPINMASKLASKSGDNQLWISNRLYEKFANKELVSQSCGCSNGQVTGQKTNLWTEKDLTEDTNLDFNTAYVLESYWCPIHGKDWCDKILQLNPT